MILSRGNTWFWQKCSDILAGTSRVSYAVVRAATCRKDLKIFFECLFRQYERGGGFAVMFTVWYIRLILTYLVESLSWREFSTFVFESKGLTSKCSGIRTYGISFVGRGLEVG